MRTQAEASFTLDLVTLPPRSAADVTTAERIKSLQREADWDGDGAEAITSEACNQAVRFLGRLPSNLLTPQIAPSTLGAVSFFWVSDGIRLLVEVNESDSVYFQQAGTDSIDRQGSRSSAGVIRIIEALFQSRAR